MNRMFRPKNVAFGTILGTAFMGLMQVGETLKVKPVVGEPDAAGKLLEMMAQPMIDMGDFAQIMDLKYLNGDFCVKPDMTRLYSELNDRKRKRKVTRS